MVCFALLVKENEEKEKGPKWSWLAAEQTDNDTGTCSKIIRVWWAQQDHYLSTRAREKKRKKKKKATIFGFRLCVIDRIRNKASKSFPIRKTIIDTCSPLNRTQHKKRVPKPSRYLGIFAQLPREDPRSYYVQYPRTKPPFIGLCPRCDMRHT